MASFIESFPLSTEISRDVKQVRVDGQTVAGRTTDGRRGAVGRVSDLRSRGRGFESRPGTRRKNSGHVSHTYVPLFTKQYKLVPAKGR